MHLQLFVQLSEADTPFTFVIAPHLTTSQRILLTKQALEKKAREEGASAGVVVEGTKAAVGVGAAVRLGGTVQGLPQAVCASI